MQKNKNLKNIKVRLFRILD